MLDTLEESVLLHRPLVIELTSGRRFEDVAKEIIKWEGEDHVVFAHHELLPVRQISNCWRTRPTEHTYNHRIS